MSKIYCVYLIIGEGEEREEALIDGFYDYDEASKYVETLRNKEQKYRQMSEKCRKCVDTIDINCKSYREPTYFDDICENYEKWAYREQIEYEIIEVDER